MKNPEATFPSSSTFSGSMQPLLTLIFLIYISLFSPRLVLSLSLDTRLHFFSVFPSFSPSVSAVCLTVLTDREILFSSIEQSPSSHFGTPRSRCAVVHRTECLCCLFFFFCLQREIKKKDLKTEQCSSGDIVKYIVIYLGQLMRLSFNLNSVFALKTKSFVTSWAFLLWLKIIKVPFTALFQHWHTFKHNSTQPWCHGDKISF